LRYEEDSVTGTQDRTFSSQLDCHYLLHAPQSVDSRTPLVVALHGFGSNPEVMLRLTGRLFETPAVVAALQGPNQFFLDAQTRDVGYGWITSRRPAESIRLHRDMVLHVLSEVGREYGIPPSRSVLVGFSQAVGANYRFAAMCPDAIRGVIGICGGIPGDWDAETYGQVSAALLHIARRQDEIYAPATTETYRERLERRAADVEFHLIDGGHQMPSEGKRIVGPWLQRVLG
jgi:phospholipase/carboxylesterase